MDFVQLIKDQNSKICGTSPYLEAIWAHLTRKADYNLETPTIEKRIFMQHLPLNLQSFLNDCTQKIQEVIDADQTINWADVKTRYLKSLLYWCLVCGEEQGSLVPLTAAQLYFMLNMLPQQQQQYSFLVENIYCAALSAIESAISCENIPAKAQIVVDKLRVFLKSNNLTKEPLMATVTVLNKIIHLDDNRRTFNQFNIGKRNIFCEYRKTNDLFCR